MALFFQCTFLIDASKAHRSIIRYPAQGGLKQGEDIGSLVDVVFAREGKRGGGPHPRKTPAERNPGTLDYFNMIVITGADRHLGIR
jgi:hypothetical protein